MENFLKKCFPGKIVQSEHLPQKIVSQKPIVTTSFPYALSFPEEGIDMRKTLSEIEDSLIHQALRKTKGNKNRASKLLCINRTTLIEKMKKKGIST